MSNLGIDAEFKSLMPPLSTVEYQELEESLKAEGCLFPLVVWDGIIIDGHNRYEICTRHGIEFEVIEHPFESRAEAKIWIIQNQFARRNLNSYQRGKLALKLKPLIAKIAKEHQRLSEGRGKKKGSPTLAKPIDTREEVSKAADVSHGTMSKIAKIEAEATLEQKELLEAGEMSVNQVYKQVRAKELRADKVKIIQEAERSSVGPLGELGKFAVIYADPPWRYEHETTGRREIENVYATMGMEAIKALPVSEIALDDCILFLWCPSPKVGEAIDAIRAWGFNYRTNFIWVKDRIGMGYYNRQRHELLLVAIKGNIPVPAPENRFDSVIESPREEHSKKPDRLYDMIEQMYPDFRKVELFARKEQPGWAVWGNEV